jgi:hypothetical protein
MKILLTLVLIVLAASADAKQLGPDSLRIEADKLLSSAAAAELLLEQAAADRTTDVFEKRERRRLLEAVARSSRTLGESTTDERHADDLRELQALAGGVAHALAADAGAATPDQRRRLLPGFAALAERLRALSARLGST